MPNPLDAPVALTSDHDCGAFDCGVPTLDEWLKRRALPNESRFSRSYVVCEGKNVVAYYSLSAGSVERGFVPGRLRRNAPDAIPVALIGRLAVDRSLAGRGIGADLFSDAAQRLASVATIIGIAAIMVHAKDARARAFYLACANFQEYPADSRTLYLPIDAIPLGSI
jgi:GNAT superfamily N-acetyltransferase